MDNKTELTEEQVQKILDRVNDEILSLREFAFEYWNMFRLHDFSKKLPNEQEMEMVREIYLATPCINMAGKRPTQVLEEILKVVMENEK